MKRNDPMLLSQIIDQAFSAADNDERVRAHRLSALWPVVVGPGINRHTVKRWVDGTVMHVHIDSAPLRQELQFGADKLLAQLNATYGADILTELRFH